MLLIIKSGQCILLCSLIKYAYTVRGGEDLLSHAGAAVSNLSTARVNFPASHFSPLLSSAQLDVSIYWTFNDSLRLVGVEEADGAERCGVFRQGDVTQLQIKCQMTYALFLIERTQPRQRNGRFN